MVYGFLKTSAIGLFAGYLDARLSQEAVGPFFEKLNWGWSFNHSWVLYPLVKVKTVTTEFLEQFIPDIFPLENVDGCNAIALSAQQLHQRCCGRFWTSSFHMTSSCIEEIIFRLLIQKIALLALAKAVPKKVKGLFSHTASRIVIASAIFAFAHDRPTVMPHFLQGLAWGIIFENCRYGLYASSVGHSVGNIFKRAIYGYPICQYQIELALSSR